MTQVILDHCVPRPPNLATRQIAILELPTNRLRVVVANADQVNNALATLLPGAYECISFRR